MQITTMAPHHHRYSERKKVPGEGQQQQNLRQT